MTKLEELLHLHAVARPKPWTDHAWSLLNIQESARESPVNYALLKASRASLSDLLATAEAAKVVLCLRWGTSGLTESEHYARIQAIDKLRSALAPLLMELA